MTAQLSQMLTFGGAMPSKSTTKGDVMFEGVDLSKALDKMMKLPSASHMTRRPDLLVRRTKKYAEVGGRASWESRTHRGLISVTIGWDATIHDVLGTLLHEVAHHSARVKKGWTVNDSNDGAPRFAQMCHDLHDEWNRRWGSRLGEVSIHISGAYRGRGNRRDHSKAHVPVRAGNTPPEVTKLVHKITTDNVHGKHWWKLAAEIHEDGVELAIPGTLACEIQYRFVDTIEEGSADWRIRFGEIWEAGRTRRMGKGSQRVIQLAANEIMFLRDAIEWSVWDYDDEPLANRQAAALLSKLINVKD